MICNIYSDLLNDPKNNINYESGINNKNVYTKRRKFESLEIQKLEHIIINNKIKLLFNPEILYINIKNNISTLILSQYEKNYEYNDLESMKVKDLEIYIFQVLIACIIFNKIGLKHNDLHYRNILSDESKKETLNYKILDNENKTHYFSIPTKIIYKIIDYEYACVPNSISYSIKYNVKHVQGFNMNNSYEPSFDFLTFITSISFQFYSYSCRKILNPECFNYVSDLLNKYYDIEYLDEYLNSYHNRPRDDIIHQPLEPLLDEFKSFETDNLDILDCYNI